MDLKEVLKKALAGEQLIPGDNQLTDEEKLERLKQREMAMQAGMQAGPMMGTIGKFGGIRNALGKLNEQPKPLKEFSYEAPEMMKHLQADDAVRETIKRSMNAPKELPPREMTAEEFEQIMKLFGGK